MPRVPRGGCGTSGGGGSAEYAWLATLSGAGQTLAASTTTTVKWYDFITTNTSVFSISSGDITLLVTAQGALSLETKVLVDDVGAIFSATLVGTAISHWDGADTAWFAAHNWIKNTSPVGGTELAVRDTATTWTAGTGGVNSVQVRLTNYDAVTHPLNVAYLKAIFVPTTNPMATVFP